MKTRNRVLGESKEITVGSVKLGGANPVAIQSMTNTKTSEVDVTVEQVLELESAGCEIIRVSIPDQESALALANIKSKINIPIVADIHFRAELAVQAINSGADKVRINPGNIGDEAGVRSIIEAAKEAKIPIRIGVNSGSIGKELRSKDLPMSEKLVLSALEYVDLLESMDFFDMALSVKSSSVPDTIDAYRGLAKATRHPLHLGVTESGTLLNGAIRSALGIGVLLEEGIGDTLRVSLAADPVHEVHVAKEILQALGMRAFHPEVIACPTCARCEVDLFSIAEKIEDYLKFSKKTIKVAVMGCVVNGPGEAADADIGLAAGKGKGVIFVQGQSIKTVKEKDFFDELVLAIKGLD